MGVVHHPAAQYGKFRRPLCCLERERQTEKGNQDHEKTHRLGIGRRRVCGLRLSRGLRLVAKPADRAATMTAAWLPERLAWAPFNTDMRSRGLVVAGGQGKWAGMIMRFGHMGMVEIDEMVDAVRVMGETMVDHGFEADASAAATATRDAYDAARTAAAVR